MALIEKYVDGFVVLANKEVEHEGKKVTPNLLVQVVSGVPTVVEKDGNCNVSVHPQSSKYAYSGYIRSDDPIAAIVKEASAKSIPLVLRFERRRKQSVDPTVDIEEWVYDFTKAQKYISKALVGLFDYSQKEWTMSWQAQASPKNDPESLIDSLLGLNVNMSGILNNGATTPNTTYNPKVDSNERSNHLISFYTHLLKVFKENDMNVSTENVQKLSKLLLTVADDIQMTVYELESPNYRDYTHTKARSLVFSYLEVNPITKETFANIKGYKEDATRFGVDTWRWANQN